MEGDVRFHFVVPDLRVLEARRCAHRWTVFHENYSIALMKAIESDPLEWRYNRRSYFLTPDQLVMAVQPGELHAQVQRSPPLDSIAMSGGRAAPATRPARRRGPAHRSSSGSSSGRWG